MIAVHAVCAAVTILPALYLLSLLRKLRRAGRPDRPGERVLAAYLVLTGTRAAATFIWDEIPTAVTVASVTPVIVLSFAFLASRIRQHPDALFGPALARRIHACREHR